jgi:hypothetical protein
MFVIFDDVVKRGLVDFRAPEGGQGRYLRLCCNTSLKKSIISGICSSDDVAVVASDTAISE